ETRQGEEKERKATSRWSDHARHRGGQGAGGSLGRHEGAGIGPGAREVGSFSRSVLASRKLVGTHGFNQGILAFISRTNDPLISANRPEAIEGVQGPTAGGPRATAQGTHYSR